MPSMAAYENRRSPPAQLSPQTESFWPCLAIEERDEH